MEADHRIEINGRDVDVARSRALVEKSQQLAEHYPNQEALDCGEKVLLGQMSADEARAEIRLKYTK